ncbi:hypothetical protein [Engelhardtia mirabilis]|uniref:Uncharacterized protein n=1 Tax=Engelhardtia mirabilis TaxID=2528011 RepID=A0A518BR83_9BACT|nr:hypothetical protein Pla133_45990 [Planctomycetes bacterium Pla133]QDV03805.1 hypothetical protein Pla86_45970 [Planctomycetes bacterium Pla86]
MSSGRAHRLGWARFCLVLTGALAGVGVPVGLVALLASFGGWEVQIELGDRSEGSSWPQRLLGSHGYLMPLRVAADADHSTPLGVRWSWRTGGGAWQPIEFADAHRGELAPVDGVRAATIQALSGVEPDSQIVWFAIALSELAGERTLMPMAFRAKLHEGGSVLGPIRSALATIEIEALGARPKGHWLDASAHSARIGSTLEGWCIAQWVSTEADPPTPALEVLVEVSAGPWNPLVDVPPPPGSRSGAATGR